MDIEVSETGQVDIKGSDGTVVTCIVNVLRGVGRSFAVLEELGREPPILHFWEYRVVDERAVVSPISDPDVRREVTNRYAASVR